MKKFIPTLFAILGIIITQNVSSQLYVSPSSYVYVADKYVYVKQDVNIQNTGNIYLRNESQLLQATSSGSTNSGAGKLSAFQEGSVNNFQYNYWCSPVGNASASSGNEPFGITMLNRPTDLTNSTPATTTTLPGRNGTANPLAVEPYWIWKYLISDGYNPGGPNGWIQVLAASTLMAGEGFTMKGTSGTDATTVVGVQNNSGSKQRYDFRGKPNDGNITISLATNLYTLTGNPYPSAIDLKAFLTSASSSTGIAYFWEHDKTINSHYIAAYQGGYGTYSPAGANGIYVPAVFYGYTNSGSQGGVVGAGNNYQRRFSPIGQGFMLMGATNGTVQMNNTFRVFVKEGAANFSQFEKNSNQIAVSDTGSDFLPAIPSISGFDYTTVSKLPTPQIRFKNVMNDTGLSQIVLAFDPAASDNVDFAMDAKSPNDDTAQELYFAMNNESYNIDVINFDINKKIPIGLRNTDAANYKISVNEILNFTDADNIYIHDKDNDTYYDIKNGVYEVNMPSGNNISRFEITFVANALNVISNSTNDFEIVQNNTNQLLMISNPKAIDLKEVSLFDISGKLIFNKSKLGNNTSYQFSTLGLSDGIYIVKLITTDNLKQGTKISVFKTK